jgi:hypothetical protein
VNQITIPNQTPGFQVVGEAFPWENPTRMELAQDIWYNQPTYVTSSTMVHESTHIFLYLQYLALHPEADSPPGDAYANTPGERLAYGTEIDYLRQIRAPQSYIDERMYTVNTLYPL